MGRMTVLTVSFFARFGARVLPLAAVLVLTGCAAMQHSIPVSELDSFTPLPESQRVLNRVRVRWELRDDVSEVCMKKVGSVGGAQKVMAKPIACAVWHVPTQECVIYTGKQVAHVTLGHELRHCFEGHFH